MPVRYLLIAVRCRANLSRERLALSLISNAQLKEDKASTRYSTQHVARHFSSPSKEKALASCSRAARATRPSCTHNMANFRQVLRFRHADLDLLSPRATVHTQVSLYFPGAVTSSPMNSCAHPGHDPTRLNGTPGVISSRRTH